MDLLTACGTYRLLLQEGKGIRKGEGIISSEFYPLNYFIPSMTEPCSQGTAASGHPWYAVRTFNCQEQKVSRYLTEKGLLHFIPMSYLQVKSSAEEGSKSKPILVPAVHNLLFVQKTVSQKGMIAILKDCPAPVSIFRQPGEEVICEIADRDMIELRMLCDPEFQTTIYMTQSEAEAIVGKDVRVVNGPFKGTVGRLVRKHKQYYFLKTVIGMGVMVRVSRWYCEAL